MHDARPIDLAALRTLRESTTAWQMALRDAPPNADPAGLYRLLVIVSPGANSIRFMAPLRGAVGPDRLLAALEEAMLQPKGAQVPARPPAIVVDDAALARDIALPMEGCGVTVSVQAHLPGVDPVLRALNQQPNLFSVPDQTQEETGQTPEETGQTLRFESEHTLGVEAIDGRPTLVVRAADGEAIEAVLRELDGIGLIPRESEGRAVEVLVGLHGDEMWVLSVLGMSDDQAGLAEELGEDEDVAVVVIPLAGEASDGEILSLPRREL